MYISKVPVEKGWSKDKKYRVTDEKGNDFLLRISPLEEYEAKKREYELMIQLENLGIPMCRALEFGTNEEGVYSVQTWIDGVDLRDVVNELTEDEQYAYGFESGKILQKIHSIPAPADVKDWEKYFSDKTDRKIRMYEECPIKFENGQAMIDFINAHRHLLKNRPQTFQHGDYHIGNMMLDKNKKLFIIDFNRSDFGDPWEEFNRIVWCAQAAPMLATGMVNGYFDNQVPMDFWKLLAFYISSNTLSSVPWAIPYGEGEVKIMIDQAKDVLAWYDDMKNPVPTWYRGTVNYTSVEKMSLL